MLKKLTLCLIVNVCCLNSKGICSDNENHINEPEWTYKNEAKKIEKSLEIITEKHKQVAERIKPIIDEIYNNDIKQKEKNIEQEEDTQNLENLKASIEEMRIWCNPQLIEDTLQNALADINNICKPALGILSDLRERGADPELCDKLQKELEAFFGK